MSRRKKAKAPRAPRPVPLPISFRRAGGEIAEDELEYRSALDNVTAGSKGPRDVSTLAVYAMYCARTKQALLDDPSVDPQALEALHPPILAAAEAIDALDRRQRAQGYAKATDAEHQALAGLLDVLAELNRVATSRAQRDAMQRVVSDAAMARRGESKNTSKQ